MRIVALIFLLLDIIMVNSNQIMFASLNRIYLDVCLFNAQHSINLDGFNASNVVSMCPSIICLGRSAVLFVLNAQDCIKIDFILCCNVI